MNLINQGRNVARFLLLLAATGLLFLAGSASADEVVGATRIVILSDDISNTTTPVKHAGEAGGVGNNGHGNNADGADSSNPSQGGGGANADGADSDPGTDDEAGGGGAAPSKDKK